MTVTEAGVQLTDLLDCRCSTPAEDSLTDYDINLIWLRMIQQGMDRYLFCTGRVHSLSDFKELVRSDVWVYAGFSKEDGEPVALGILDDFQGASAKLHYTFFRHPESLRNKERYAKALADFLFANGSIDVLILLTPEVFRHANRMARNIGAEYVGSIPSMIPILRDDHFEFGECNLYKLVSPAYHKGMTRPVNQVYYK